MDEFTVKLHSYAVQELEDIYSSIGQKSQSIEIAENLISQLESAILSLESFPESESYRRTGAYAGRKYRQLIVGHFVVIYKVNLSEKTVIVVTVRNTSREF